MAPCVPQDSLHTLSVTASEPFAERICAALVRTDGTERGWLQAERGEVVDGAKAMAAIRERIKTKARKRA